MQDSNISKEDNYFVARSLIPLLYREGPHSLNIISWESDRSSGPQALQCISDSYLNFSCRFCYLSGLISFFISGTLRFPPLYSTLSYKSQSYYVFGGWGPAVSAQSILLTGNKSMGFYKLNSLF